MPAKRFVVDLDGHPRSLFSVVESGDETTLGLKSSSHNMKLGQGAPLSIPISNPTEILQQKYSIHPSPESEQGINVIKQTLLLADGRKIPYYHYTRAIKSGENFAFVFCRRCGQLEQPHYIARGTSHISLGSYDPTRFVLIYAVIVGAKETEFSHQSPIAVNVKQVVFNNLRLIVLWSFLSVPSHPSTFSAHISNDPRDPESWLGDSADECVRFFAKHAIDLREELFELQEKAHPPEDMAIFRRFGQFFQVGFTDTREYQNYWFCLTRHPYYDVRYRA